MVVELIVTTERMKRVMKKVPYSEICKTVNIVIFYIKSKNIQQRKNLSTIDILIWLKMSSRITIHLFVYSESELKHIRPTRSATPWRGALVKSGKHVGTFEFASGIRCDSATL